MPGGDDDNGPTADGSPQKRGRTQDPPLTLAMLKEVLAAERNLDREHLAQRLEQAQGDVQAIRGRVDSVEQGVTTQMEKTMGILSKITGNYDEQAKILGELRQAQGSSSSALRN